MACLFGHKWNGCTCAKCSATRDENHKWEPMEGFWGKCPLCGKTRKAKPRNGMLIASCMLSDDRKIIDNALTFIMNLNVNGNPNTVNECAKLSSKLLSHKNAILTTGDLQLATAAVIQYAKSIPTLIEINPQYAEHKAELQEDYEYIGHVLLPELTRLFEKY